jgi:hypothetical protein
MILDAGGLRRRSLDDLFCRIPAKKNDTSCEALFALFPLWQFACPSITTTVFANCGEEEKARGLHAH